MFVFHFKTPTMPVNILYHKYLNFTPPKRAEFHLFIVKFLAKPAKPPFLSYKVNALLELNF